MSSEELVVKSARTDSLDNHTTDLTNGNSYIGKRTWTLEEKDFEGIKWLYEDEIDYSHLFISQLR